MFSRFGLRFRMAASYILVSAAAVLVVEAILLAIFIPQVVSARDSAQAAQQHAQVEQQQATLAETTLAEAKAGRGALEIASAAGTSASAAELRQPTLSDSGLLAYAAGHRALGPPVNGPGMALATLDGHIVAQTGMNLLSLPAKAVNPAGSSGQQTASDSGLIVWASEPVSITDSTGGVRVIGLAYQALPPPKRATSGTGRAGTSTAGTPAATQPGSESVTRLLVIGALVLLLLVPVGAVFGMLSTGRLITRIRRLAVGADAMAEGDLRYRVPVSDGDEVGQLEHALNAMAAQLEQAITAERDAAGSMARRAERTRIARELHDSISQDLFSASLVATGLRKALPSGTKLWGQAESMEGALERTRREMRALLMELRPVALEDSGLAAALEEMCRAYQTRLGIAITARISLSDLSASVEHAVLRVVQEALGNAVRHGNPDTIEVVADSEGERVSVMIRDDGRGFDLDRVTERYGMGLELIRERVEELGGTVTVDTAPLEGTTVQVTL
jgi:signal transduction histidine kinase